MSRGLPLNTSSTVLNKSLDWARVYLRSLLLLLSSLLDLLAVLELVKLLLTVLFLSKDDIVHKVLPFLQDLVTVTDQRLQLWDIGFVQSAVV